MALTRSEQMARIRGSGTSPEVAFAEALVLAGAPATSGARLFGSRPDLVIEDRRIAIFIDGCFWHGCPRHYTRPGTRSEFWAHKLSATVERDRRQTAALEAAGWTVVRCWEHEVATELAAIVAGIVSAPGVRPARPDWRVFAVSIIDEDARIERRHLVDLRDESLQSVVDGRRDTSKWARRPARG